MITISMYVSIMKYILRRDVTMHHKPYQDPMKRNIFFPCFLLAALCLLLGACSPNPKKALNQILIEAADKDGTIDKTDWKRITDFISSHKKSFQDWYDQDRLDEDDVEEYISNFFADRRPAKEVNFEYADVQVNFYLERSGSMVAYDSPKGDGSFKSAIVTLLNALPGNDNRMYVVNSQITPYPEGIANFVHGADIFEATKGLGDPSYTDFGSIFNELLNKTDKNTLSILVTDMIYSTKDMAGVNPERVFAEAGGMINHVFRNSVRSKSILILKMNASYNGPYYAYNSTASKNYNGSRPYYIVLVGENKLMRQIARNADFSTFREFAHLKGYENQYLFATSEYYEPYYSLLLSGKDTKGRFVPERGQGNRIRTLESVHPDEQSGTLQLELAVDMGGMFIPESMLTDPSNYTVDAKDKFVIRSIRRVNPKEIRPNEAKYMGRATHIMVLSSEHYTGTQDIEIKLNNTLPQWVAQSNDYDDTDIEPHTTFGLLPLMRGIYDSYAKNSKGRPCYFEMEIELKR